MSEANGRYRILSLDGGGSWALIQVKALMAIYGDVPGHEVLRDFDLVVANSGGSITAAALFSNIRLSQALAFFTTESWRRQMFVERAWPLADLARATVGPRYIAREKIKGLRKVLGGEGAGAAGGIEVADTLLTDLPGLGAGLPHLVIVAFDYYRRRATFFRSNAGSFSGGVSQVTLARAVHASSNAPVNYFDDPARVLDRLYWDGGVTGFNNPILAGVTEALSTGTLSHDQIDVRSIGTGSLVLPQAPAPLPAGVDPVVWEEYASTGFVQQLTEMTKSILADPPDSASYIAYVTLGGVVPSPGAGPSPGARRSSGPLPVVRLNPLIQPLHDPAAPGEFVRPPGLSSLQFNKLRGLDMDAIRKEEVDLIELLADLWLAGPGDIPNQPVRWNRTTFAVEIGHRWAAEAIADWGRK